jgi:hypothetical protein
MARLIQSRPPLREAAQKFDATRADDMVGIRQQELADGAGSTNVAVDVEANLVISRESTNAPTFTGCDLTDEATPAIARTFKRAAGTSQVVTVTLTQSIDGNTSYTLDTAGAALTIAPAGLGGDSPAWEVISALGTVSAVP